MARRQVLLAAVVMWACFFYAIPKFASFSEVWTEIETITPFEIGILLVATALNLVTYWWQNMVSIPGSGLWQVIQIPIGGVTYVIWKAKRRWRQPTPVPVPVAVPVP